MTESTSEHDVDDSTTEAPDGESDDWWAGHYHRAADETIAFLRDDGTDLAGLRVADIGCGDGITDLALAHRSGCAALVGFDINPVDLGALEANAGAHGVPPVPKELTFSQCEPTRLPAPADDFDVVLSWSAFEHIRDPAAVCQEVRRVIRPQGVFFVQLWPFFASQFGSHLEDWWPEGWVQKRLDADVIEQQMRARGLDASWTEMKVRDYRELNRSTLDELQTVIQSAGFRLCRVQLYTHTIIVPPDLQSVPLSDLMISGVMLTARPDTPVRVATPPLSTRVRNRVGRWLLSS